MIFLYFFAFGLFVILFTREVIAPATGASCDKRWRIFAGALNTANAIVVVAAGLFFAPFIARFHLFSLPEWVGLAWIDSIWQSGVVFLTASLLAYGWHRLCHAHDGLWRMIHQLHHSPSRIETLTAFYAHPVDSFAASTLNALVAYGVFGVGPETAAMAMAYVALFNLVAHADIRTPWWLGLIIQRPEMHRLHHEHGKHAGNYSLPVIDMMFGTWHNPRTDTARTVTCGFKPENEYRIKEMLLMKDVGG